MKTLTTRLLDRLRETLWIIPTICGPALLELALEARWIDRRSPFASGLRPFSTIDLRAGPPGGFRAVLTTIAGSMFGFSGVSFSITVAARLDTGDHD